MTSALAALDTGRVSSSNIVPARAQVSFDTVIASGHDIVVTMGDFVQWLRIGGNLSTLLDPVGDAIVYSAAQRLGIRVRSRELQKGADAFRREHSLENAGRMMRWLDRHHMTVDDFQKRIELEILRERVRDAVAVGKIRRYFAQHRISFDRAKLRLIVARSIELANRLRGKISEGTSFANLAAKHSTDNATRESGGFIGWVARADLAPNHARLIFASHTGDVVGPVALGAGYALIRIEALRRARLTTATILDVKTRLFEEWLDRQWRRSAIQLIVARPQY